PCHLHARPAACFLYYYFSVYVINSKNSFFVPPAFCRKRVQRYIEISIPTRETAIIFDILAIIDLNQGKAAGKKRQIEGKSVTLQHEHQSIVFRH
ncbi:MAG: hypothetical protein SPE56_00620, partial [Prevotella sp.]|nr:hypothetical protein [Prevotella sp.]